METLIDPPPRPKYLETDVFTKEEAEKRRFFFPNPENMPYLAVAFVIGNPVYYQWFHHHDPAVMWSLEKTAWVYNE